MKSWTIPLAGVLMLSVITYCVMGQGPGPRMQGPEGGPGTGGGPAGQNQGRPFDPMRMPLMTGLDANGDGELSAEEIAAASEALKKLDENNDGKLSRDELRPQFGGPEGRGMMGAGGRGPGGGGAMGPVGMGSSGASLKLPLGKH